MGACLMYQQALAFGSLYPKITKLLFFVERRSICMVQRKRKEERYGGVEVATVDHG